MDAVPQIRPMKDRRYAEIPIDKMKVINSRDRDQAQFEMNLESIDHVGLMKPIRVNDRFLAKTGFYELICGEGRLLAHKKLGRTAVMAEVVTCSRKEAYLQSLVENIARTKPGSMDFARELKRLRDEGWDFTEIARLACKSESYIRELIRLVDRGEERLIQGVEQGVFPMKFAMRIVATDDTGLQGLLMDAFDEGLVTTANFSQARRLIAARARSRKRSNNRQGYSVQQLQQDIADATQAKTSYVREAQVKENRFLTLLDGINALWKDPQLLAILSDQGLMNRPELVGEFAYEPSPGSAS